MGPAVLVVFLLASGPGADSAANANASPRLQVEKVDARDETPAARDLTTVRRIYVDVLTGGEAAARLRDMLMASLQKTRLFIVTENQDRADAVLKGAADDKIFTDRFRSSDNLNMHTQVGASDRSSESRYYSEGESHSAGFGIGESESSSIEERKHEAIAAVRLVNREGDVIWSATEESLGGKFLGASADVADKIARQITADYHRLQSAASNQEKGAPVAVR
ncbi:MAG: hypothetical protein ABSF98_23010 [Bryobacteraceae bacterium]|jgi:hypothetical protein